MVHIEYIIKSNSKVLIEKKLEFEEDKVIENLVNSKQELNKDLTDIINQNIKHN